MSDVKQFKRRIKGKDNQDRSTTGTTKNNGAKRLVAQVQNCMSSNNQGNLMFTRQPFYQFMRSLPQMTTLSQSSLQ